MPTKPGQGRLVLLAEDDSALVAVIGEVLDYEGYRFVSASDGDHALTLLRDTTPDFALIDLHINGAPGLVVVDAIQRNRPDVRVILMSGDQFGGLPPGVTFLRKPFTIDMLLSVLE